MKILFNSMNKQRKRYRKGAATIEFIIIGPLFLFLTMVVWQLAVSGMAVLDTQAALRDAVKVASISGDPKRAEKVGRTTFGEAKQYSLKSIKVKIEDGEVRAKAKTKVSVLFMNSAPFYYKTSSKAPALQRSPGAAGFALGGGKLAYPTEVAPGCDINCYPTHTGQDFPGDIGTPVYAAENGVVESVIDKGNTSYGTYIVIDHGGGLKTLYAHMYDWQPLVDPGESVIRGQPIGAIGNNGNSTGPHLHFEVRVNGVPVDPMLYLTE